MKGLQKMGAVAALYSALAYLAGFALYGFVLDYGSAVEPLQKVALLADNQSIMFLLTLFVYVIVGVFLVVLALALYQRLKAGAPGLAQTAAAFGLIWACVVIASGLIFNTGMAVVVDLYATDPTRAATVWMAINSVFEGMGGGTEILGGIWILLLSWAALRTGELPKVLNYLGLLIGLVGIVSIVPTFEVLTSVFGITQIVWFAWVGIDILVARDRAT